jgi:hypothetical protein
MTMSDRKRTKKPWTRMTLAELREATKQFDREIPLEETRPLPPQEQREWDSLERDSIRRKRSRSGRVVAVRLDPKLLERTDQYAQERGITRDELINRSLKSVLTFVDG